MTPRPHLAAAFVAALALAPRVRAADADAVPGELVLSADERTAFLAGDSAAVVVPLP